MLAADLRSAGATPRESGACRDLEQRDDLRASPLARLIPSVRASSLTCSAVGSCARAKSSDSSRRCTRIPRARAARARSVPSDAGRSAILAEPEHAFEVVAVSAALELCERAVAERGDALAGSLAGLERGGRRAVAPGAMLVGRRHARRRRAGWQERLPGAAEAIVARVLNRTRTGVAAGPTGSSCQSVGAACASSASSGESAGPSQEMAVEPCLASGQALEVDRAAQQQALARAGHGHVEDAVLLARLRCACVPRRAARSPASGSPLPPSRRTSCRPMRGPSDEQVGHAVVLRATEVGHAHDGELQALGGVDAHQAHGVRLHALDRGVGLARRARPDQVLDVVEEGPQVAPFARLEAALRGEASLSDVGQPPLAPLERRARAPRSRCGRSRARSALRSSGASSARAPRRDARRSRQDLAVVRGQLSERLCRPDLGRLPDRAPALALASASSARPSRETPTSGEAASSTAPARPAGWRARAGRRGDRRPAGAPRMRPRPPACAGPPAAAPARRPRGRRARAAARRPPRPGPRRREPAPATRRASRRASAWRQRGAGADPRRAPASARAPPQPLRSVSSSS